MHWCLDFASLDKCFMIITCCIFISWWASSPRPYTIDTKLLVFSACLMMWVAFRCWGCHWLVARVGQNSCIVNHQDISTNDGNLARSCCSRHFLYLFLSMVAYNIPSFILPFYQQGWVLYCPSLGKSKLYIIIFVKMNYFCKYNSLQ